MQTITRQQVQQKVQQDAALIDVLSSGKFDEYHLPDAINVPVGDNFEEQIAQVVPDRDREVIVYCYDTDCHASEKAAARLDQMGYSHVFDYEAGKADWKEAGLPVES